MADDSRKISIKLKRIYADPEETDGFRILTDRLWPRGISREKARLEIGRASCRERV